MKSIFAMSAFCFFIVGCVTAPSASDQLHAYYGPPPKNAEQVIRDSMSRVLKDPMSATYRLQGWPKQMYVKDGMFGSSFKYGWGVCAGINAKNSFGGYVGEKMYFFLIQDDVVVYSQDSSFTKLCAQGL